MNGFRIGFIATLSFLLVTAVFSGTMGYFPPPDGPKAPEYPDYSGFINYSQPLTVLNQIQSPQAGVQQAYGPIESDYDKELKKYQEDLKKYEEEQKTFVDREVIPYVRNVLMAWIGLQVLFVLIGLLFIKINSDLVGSGFAFSSIWTILFLPLCGVVWYVNILVSSFARKAEETYSTDPILQAVMWTSIVGVLMLTIFGNILYGKFYFRKTNTQQNIVQ